MKRTLSILLALMLVFSLAACGKDTDSTSSSDTENAPPTTESPSSPNDGTSSETPKDLWSGVDGDSLTFSLNFIDELVTTINRDGSCIVNSVLSDYVNVADIDFPGLDAEVAVYYTYYGNYKIENDYIAVNCDAQAYYRMAVRGKDAEAFKTAFLENSLSAEYKDIFDKGIIRYEETGTILVSFTADPENCRLLKSSSLDKDGKLTSDIVANQDGSYIETLYHPNGNKSLVSEYTADGECPKSTSYNEDGSLEYVETSQGDQYHNTSTRVDVNGNIIQVDEYIQEELEDSQCITMKTTKTDYVDLWIRQTFHDGSLYEYTGVVDGNEFREHISLSPDGHNTTYYMSKYTVDGVVAEYHCFQSFMNIEVGDLRSRSITYDVYTDTYVLQEEYYDPSGGTAHETEIPAAEYTLAEWETPIWPQF